MRDAGTTPDTHRIYRYDYTNLSAGGTLMTIAGSKVIATNDNLLQMTTDGTSFYINFEAGNSANGYILAKYSLSGTTLTYVSSITVGTDASVAAGRFQILSSGNIYSWGSGTLTKYNSSGSLQYTDALFFADTILYNIENTLFSRAQATGLLTKLNYTD